MPRSKFIRCLLCLVFLLGLASCVPVFEEDIENAHKTTIIQDNHPHSKRSVLAANIKGGIPVAAGNGRLAALDDIGAVVPNSSLPLAAAEIEDAGNGAADTDTELPAGSPDFADGVLGTDSSGMSVNIDVTADAEIPSESKVAVTEIPTDSDRYETYMDRLVGSLGAESESKALHARFYDISILSDGKNVEPASSVSVEMVSDDIREGDEVVHFAGEDEEIAPVDADVSNGAAAFVTESFSVYGIYRYIDADLVDNLDGCEIIIANANPANNYIGFVTSEPKDQGLAGLKGYRRFHRLTFPTDDELNPNDLRPGVWTFHAITEPDPSIGVTQAILDNPDNAGILYTLSAETADGTRYMKLGKNSISLSTTPVPLRVVPGSGEHEGKVMIYIPKGMPNSEYRLNLKSGDITRYFQGSNWSDINENDWFVLFKTENMEIVAENEQNMANKASVSDLVDGQEVVIYHSEWDATTNSYVQLAINGYGDLVLLTDEGGTVGWYTQYAVDSGKKMSSVKWEFVVGYNTDGTPSGYYWLKNTDTGAFLSPRALYDFDGNKIADIILPGEDIVPGTPESFDYSVQLPGRHDGAFVSSLTAWSYRDGTEGIRIVENPEDVFGYEVQKGLFGDADEFNFAIAYEEEELTEKRTVDTTAMGVQIKLYDYTNRRFMNGLLGSNSISNISNDKRTWFVPELVEPIMQNGIPVSSATGLPLTEMFGDDIAIEANHLFLESVYNETGYLGYDSAQDYAYFDQDTGDFIVYNDLGAPRGNSAVVRSHGHFMPFSRLLSSVWNEKNVVDKFTHDLPIDDPRYGDAVHQIETAPNLEDGYDYSFAMTVETNFMQTLTKLDEYGHDSILEFTGDDDLWVFIDNVLVLDLGGIHSAVSGKVNFTTGQITYDGFIPKSADGLNTTVDYPPTTIKGCFEKAGIFPDGTPWDPSQIDAYFEGDTLKSAFRGHSMKLFYLERGGNSSNFEARFNLRPVRTDAVLVGKVLSETHKQSFMQSEFMFQAFEADGTPMTDAKIAEMTPRGMWNMTDEDLEFETVTIGDVTYENVFRLGHGQGAYFPLEADDEYYVKEIGVDGEIVGEVKVNENLTGPPTRTSNQGDPDLDDVSSSVMSANERREIVFDNQMLSHKLNITKSLDLHSSQRPDPNETFQFRMMVGKDEASLRQYSVQPYYIKTMVGGEEVYCTRVDGKIVPLSRRPDGTYYYLVDGNEVTIANRDATDPVFDYSSQNGYIDYVPAGYTVELQGMMPGMAFSVEETNLPSGYHLSSISDAGSNTFRRISEVGDTVLVGKMLPQTDAKISVVNAYDEGTFRLRKVSSDNAIEYLAGAKFELYDQPPEHVDGQTVFHPYDLVTRFESDEDGYFRVVADDEGHGYYGGDVGTADLKLAVGTYYLLETQVPDGFSLHNPVSSFWIANDGTFHINGLVDWDPITGEIIYTSQDNLEVGEDTDIGGVVLQTGMISNVRGPGPISLPLTGMNGSGILLISAGIASLIIGEVLVFYRIRRGGKAHRPSSGKPCHVGQSTGLRIRMP